MRSTLQSVVELIAKRNYKGGTIVFPHLNKTLFSIIENVGRDGYQIKFLPRLEDPVYDWGYVNIDDQKFKKRFDELTERYIYWFGNSVKWHVVDRLNKADLCQMAALRAAREARIETVYLEHGHSGGYHPNVMAGWILNFDYVYVQDNSMRKYLIQESIRHKCYPIVRGWKELKLRKWKPGGNIILYAPTLMSGSDRFERLIPETLRWKFKKAVLKCLSDFMNYSDYKVTYKYFGQGGDQSDPAPASIRNKYPKIKISDKGNLIRAMRRCSLFITDTVSTPLYHAAEMGVPSLCLEYLGGVQTRSDIKERWKNILFPFDNEKDLEGRLYDWLIDNGGKLESPDFIKVTIDKFPWEEK